jgi:L-fuconolactonase
MNAEQQAWLNQVIEEPLHPDRRICDPHHHLWDHSKSRYLAGDLLADTAPLNVVSTVFVECMSAYRSDGPDDMKPVGRPTSSNPSRTRTKTKRQNSAPASWAWPT